MTVRDRLSDRKFARHMRLIGSAVSKPFCLFIDGHLLQGVQSKHRLAAARKVHALERFKYGR